MSILSKLFSKPQQKTHTQPPNILNNELPQKLRQQICNIIESTIGNDFRNALYDPTNIYKKIHDDISDKYGLDGIDGFGNYQMPGKAYMNKLLYFIKNSHDINTILDIIELSLNHAQDYDAIYWHRKVFPLSSQQAIHKLNERFKENDVNYRFENGKIIKIDSTIIYQEIIKPAITLLYNEKFNNACNEYLEAHEHYKNNKNKECIHSCARSLESTLKIIFSENGWDYDDEKAGLTKLICICFEKKLIPDYMQTQFDSLRNMLQNNGIGKIRNKYSGHGQGTNIKVADDILTRLVLNLTATFIIFLVETSNIK